MHSTNLHWRYDEQLVNLLEQAVVISQVRVIVTLKDTVDIDALLQAMRAYNEREQQCFHKRL
eukprot:6174959-Alexandrium_andersonii.AAC.1